MNAAARTARGCFIRTSGKTNSTVSGGRLLASP